jgi:PPOX class probable F420-dependent enzyme
MAEQVLPRKLEAFLNAQRVARLATVDAHGRPHVVPVCFAYIRGVVYIVLDAKPKRVPVRNLQRVRNLLANPEVQLLADIWDEDWSQLAYLQLRGSATLLDPGPEQAEALHLLLQRYPQYGAMALDDAPVIRIAVTSSYAWGASAGRD